MHVIDLNAVYTVASAAKSLGLPEKCLFAAIRAGELPVSKKGRTYFIIGDWLLAWIESGKMTKADRCPRCQSESLGRDGAPGGAAEFSPRHEPAKESGGKP